VKTAAHSKTLEIWRRNWEKPGHFLIRTLNGNQLKTIYLATFTIETSNEPDKMRKEELKAF
jgi:hypothetical protein